jgi:hypothetical protein
MIALLKRYRRMAAAAPLIFALTSVACAQAPYPNRTITLVLPFAVDARTSPGMTR